MLNSAAAARLGTLADVTPDCGWVRYGALESCSSTIAEVAGLALPIGARVGIERAGGPPVDAEVIGFKGSRAIAMLEGDAGDLHPAARVRAHSQGTLVAAGDALLGRVIDASGTAVDGGPAITLTPHLPLAGRQAGALDRARVTAPFDSGVRAINALLTMGEGQRVGIMAGSGVGKSVLLGMIAEAADCDVAVVALIGERAREITDFIETKLPGAARARTVVVAVPGDRAPVLRVRGAMRALAIAEHFRDQGRRVLLIMDSLTRVAHAGREIGLALGEPASARGYPPSALALIPKLVERAGACHRGGAITAIFTVLADGDNQDDPVVDTARAILDGHYVLSRRIAERGLYPAFDIGASISRVMHDIVPPDQAEAARVFRALTSVLEDNRDLVLMGAYRPGSDALLDRALALQAGLDGLVRQGVGERVSLGDAADALAALTGA